MATELKTDAPAGLVSMSKAGAKNWRPCGLITLGISALLVAACGGGGGGGGASPSVSASVTCPNGATSSGTGVDTAAATTAANAACPVGKVSSVSPADGSASVDPGAFTAVTVTTDSALDATSLAAANVTLKAGQVAVTSAVAASGTKGFTLTPAAKLSYGQPYSFAYSVKDTLGRVISGTAAFSTSAIVCTAPFVPATDGQSCVDTTLHYTDKVIAIWEGGQLFSVDKTAGANLLVNKTIWTTGFYPLANCWLPTSGPLADGRILASCQDAGTLHRHYLYIDPLKNEVHEYTGQVPVALACTENANLTWSCPANSEWRDVQSSPPSGAPNGAGSAVHVIGGWFFNTNVDQNKIFYADSATGVVVVVGGYQTGVSLQLLAVFNN